MIKEKPMKVAIVSHAHPSLSKGGAEISAYTLYQGLLELGVPAIFIAAVPQERLSEVVLQTDGERILPFEAHHYSHTLQLGSLALARDLADLLLAEAVTVVNFHHYINLGLAVFREVKTRTGLPVFLTLHEYLAICANHGQMVTHPGGSLCTSAAPARCANCFPAAGQAGMATRASVFQNAFAYIDGFISPSQFLLERYAEWGLRREQITLIENGLSGFSTPLPRAARRDGAPVTFAYFGQINPFKGMDVLLDAMDLLAREPDLCGRFQIRAHGNRVGLAPDFETKMDAAIAQHDFFEAPGPYDNRMIMQLMGEADYVLVPSRWWENSPVVIQEAFAARCPVICSGIGGMAEKVIDGVSGFHFRMGSAQDLAAVMRRAIAGAKLKTDNLPVPSCAGEMALHYLDLFSGGSHKPVEKVKGAKAGRKSGSVVSARV